MDVANDQMLYVSFNQDYSAFSVGTERGIRVYNTYPYKDYYERIMEGGIGIVEMLYKSNILALVGGGKYPRYAKNKVIIWDDNQCRVIADLSFNTYVKSLKLKKERVIVVCETKIYLFNMINFQNIDTLDTFENSKGILAITYDPKMNILAYPDKASGYVKLKNYEKNETILMNAHNTRIALLSLSSDGKFLATASEKGKKIKIFSTEDGNYLNEYYVEKSPTDIYSISFNMANNFLLCSCSTGTIHVFNLKSALEKYLTLQIDKMQKFPKLKTENHEGEKNSEVLVKRDRKSFWQKLGFLSHESSWALFRIPETKSIAAFYSANILITVSSEGRYYVATFNPEKHENCLKIEELCIDINPTISY